jgi:hypothetical protein
MARGFDCVDFPFFLVNSCVIVGDVDCGGGVPEKKQIVEAEVKYGQSA